MKGGRCEACQGDGVLRVEMHFLPDVFVTCDACGGKRYNRETLEVKYRGLSIADALDVTVEQASELFGAVPRVADKLEALRKVGLGYVTLGQPATTLSGGEAQRVKLARELARKATGRTLYVLDEPTTGLHFADIEVLLTALTDLRDQGNTVVVIEHNLDVVACADWVIDLGPEGGEGGGEIVGAGTPEQIARIERSHTGRYLATCSRGRGRRRSEGEGGARSTLAALLRVAGAAEADGRSSFERGAPASARYPAHRRGRDVASSAEDVGAADARLRIPPQPLGVPVGGPLLDVAAHVLDAEDARAGVMRPDARGAGRTRLRRGRRPPWSRHTSSW